MIQGLHLIWMNDTGTPSHMNEWYRDSISYEWMIQGLHLTWMNDTGTPSHMNEWYRDSISYEWMIQGLHLIWVNDTCTPEWQSERYTPSHHMWLSDTVHHSECIIVRDALHYHIICHHIWMYLGEWYTPSHHMSSRLNVVIHFITSMSYTPSHLCDTLHHIIRHHIWM